MKKTKSAKPTSKFLVLGFWLLVTLPLLWGVWSTIKKALALFA